MDRWWVKLWGIGFAVGLLILFTDAHLLVVAAYITANLAAALIIRWLIIRFWVTGFKRGDTVIVSGDSEYTIKRVKKNTLTLRG